MKKIKLMALVMLFCFLISSVAFAKPVNNWIYVGTSSDNLDLFVDSIDVYAPSKGIVWAVIATQPTGKNAGGYDNLTMIQVDLKNMTWVVLKDGVVTGNPAKLTENSLLHKAVKMAMAVVVIRD